MYILVMCICTYIRIYIYIYIQIHTCTGPPPSLSHGFTLAASFCQSPEAPLDLTSRLREGFAKTLGLDRSDWIQVLRG